MKNLIVLMALFGVTFGQSTNQIIDNQKAKILIVSGCPWNTDSQTAEIIDINNANANCKSWPAYPLRISDASGGLMGNIPIICGGYDKGSSDQTNKCYSYDHQNNKWTSQATLQSKRSGLASVQLPNNDGLWISGGISGFSPLSSTEIIYANKTSKPGPSLKRPLLQHCVVKLEQNNEYLVTGGDDFDLGTDETSILNWETQQFRSGPSMHDARNGHGCCVFKSKAHQNRPVVLVAGSYLGNGQYTAEILDVTLENPHWERLPNLPKDMDYGVRALPNPTEDGAILLYRDEIYELSYGSSGWEWKKQQQNLMFDRYNYAAMYVPDELTEC